MKLYTTSQAIRILERYPNRGYAFQAGTSRAYYPMRITVPEPGPHAVFESKPHGAKRFAQCCVVFRSDWHLVRPKRKRGRSVVLGTAVGSTAVIWVDPERTRKSASLPQSPSWTLIAVEKTDGRHRWSA